MLCLVCIYTYAPNECLVPEEARGQRPEKQHQMPWIWSYTQLWATMWILQPRSPGRTASELSLQPWIYLLFILCVWVSCLLDIYDGQSRLPDPLQLQLQMVVNCHVNYGIQGPLNALHYWAISLPLLLFFFLCYFFKSINTSWIPTGQTLFLMLGA